MAKDPSSSPSKRFSSNGYMASPNLATGNSSTLLPVFHYPPDRHLDVDLDDTELKSKKARTSSPPLLSDRSNLRRHLSKRPYLLFVAVGLGLLLPIWIFASGVVTLDTFNDNIRYLPGYSIFANNLLYLVMFLLLASFTVLATLPILPVLVLGLPLHLLIFSIFNKLMESWLWWCLGCYTVLFLAPFASSLVARGKQLDARRERSKSSYLAPPAPSYAKYSPLHNDFGGNGASELGSGFDAVWSNTKDTLAVIGSRIESMLYIFSTANRTSIRWRVALALFLWLTYVVPVTLENEPREFNPARAAASFDIKHPEPLCSARELEGSTPRFDSFEGYWNEYLEFHSQTVLPEKLGGIPQNDKRFLVFQPSDDGLGNRLQALLSAVVMAMVSRRAIVNDWRAMPQCNANFTDLFEQPEGLAWDVPTAIPNFKEDPPHQIWFPYCRNCALRSPITPESTWSRMLCEADLGFNSSKPIVEIISTQWFLPVIQHNPHWRTELCHMFPDGGKNAFEILAKKLLKPSAPVQEKIDSVMTRIPKDATLVGLQVRRTENNAVGQGIEDAFLSCAAEVVEDEEEKQQATGAAMAAGQPKFAYYLATDYRPTRAHFQKVLGDQLFVLDSTFQYQKPPPSLTISNSTSDQLSGIEARPALSPAHSSASLSSSSSSSTPNSQTEAVVRNSIQGVQTAVAEMYLLAQADRIISSPYSTFGYFAHGYANVQPNIVKRDGTCIERRSTQPCFQYWFGFANGGAKCSIKSTIEMDEDYDCWL
ncbi:hypothetical protein BGZ98_009931 [Dissophora globulifera]|nr:hypothetical protein BGZ98_009931 [Dissophora globulifera]